MALTRMAATPRYRLTDAGRREALAALPGNGMFLDNIIWGGRDMSAAPFSCAESSMVFGLGWVGLVRT
jgi:hypothetical protein